MDRGVFVSSVETLPQIETLVAGKYRIERELARGGLGIVVVAMHVELGHRVAIKYLKPHVLDSADLVERFKREAQLAAAIRSDHVVRVFDVGTSPDLGPYMVMELLEGEDLGSVLSRGTVLPELAIDYIVQACDALAEAHGMGVVHRDLKPDNLFLARRTGAAPVLKILDFGISKVSETTKIGERNEPRRRRLTAAGDRFGTPVYMSPEQIAATGNVDLRTDIWSLGVVLFELLTADLPFAGESIPELGANIVSARPTLLRERLPVASEALEAVISKCLEKDPAKRYRNVAELVDELVMIAAPASVPRSHRIRQLVTESGSSVRPPRTMAVFTPIEAIVPAVPAPSSPPALPRSRLPIAIGIAAIVIAAVGASFVLTRRTTPLVPTTALVQPAPSTPRVTAAPIEIVQEPTATSTPEPVKPTPPPTATTTAKPIASTNRPAPIPAAPAAPKKPASDYDQFGERR